MWSEPVGLAETARAHNSSVRLQELISGWRGVERGEPLEALHRQSLEALSPNLQHLVPARLLPIRDLELARVDAATRNFTPVGTAQRLRFRVAPTGRFDSALVPVSSTDTGSNRWLLAIEESLSGRDQSPGTRHERRRCLRGL
jgi:hypothetical protein